MGLGLGIEFWFGLGLGFGFGFGLDAVRLGEPAHDRHVVGAPR